MKQRINVSLDTIYGAEEGPVFMTGIQALVRLPMEQRRLDRQRGLNTAGLVTGYRGSPLGAYDQQLWKASKYLAKDDVVFQPGLNEDLAATALWGAQMHKAYGETTADGVFGIWYGKGNGVDRTGDAFRNANVLGTSRLGGVLAVGGDDHAAQSSMFPHQTDGIFQSVMMPILQPATVSEILSLGLAGFALSRFSGLWVAMKTIAEVVESAASFELPSFHAPFIEPADAVPAHGLNWDPRIAWPAQRTELERRMIDERLPAVTAWARANRIDGPVLSGGNARLCIVTVGKAHQDVMQAFANLGVDAAMAQAMGISVYKVALSWPLDTDSLLAFADRFEEILVVEEKRPLVEEQIKSALFNRLGVRPRVAGKADVDGAQLLPQTLEFNPLQVARVIVRRMPDIQPLAERLAALEAATPKADIIPFPARKPFFCSGCPHNSSTKTPEGSIAGGGIGCHVMALSQPRLKTATFSQMGGEGLQWVGAAPFSQTQHIFQNLGDGTYQHSGLLAIRAAVASKANITFKILYNDAVAMTGGQPAEGVIDPARITRQLAAEGVSAIYLVSDDPAKWRDEKLLAADVTIEYRDALEGVQRRLRDIPGVTAIVYEQTCAAEKRRRRKRGDFPDPDRRIFINPRVCEGCGDCSVQSNCIAVEPLQTDFGTKRRINQSSCNKDFSCVKGFCPSFVEVEGAVVRKPDGDRLRALEVAHFADLPLPTPAQRQDIANIYVAGIGGLGVLTVGALLGTAAHIDGMGATVLDFTGLAQKNGAVVSQVRIAPQGQDIHAVRIGAGEVDLLLGTDAVVAASADALGRISATRSVIVLNDDETPTADIVTDRDFSLPLPKMIDALEHHARTVHRLPATRLAEGLFGNSVAANTLIVGFAWQHGLIPVEADAVRDAIKANGAAISLNLRAFDWGRLAAVNPGLVAELAGLIEPAAAEESFEQRTARWATELVGYQDQRYAARYAGLIAQVQAASAGLGDQGTRFADAVARNAYKLMAYKDEYEVARLYADPAFAEALGMQFSDRKSMSVYLAPPLLSRIDPATGRPRKRKFGSWIFPVFRLLAKGKVLRGSWADPFGYTHERRAERQWADEYLALIIDLCGDLNAATLPAAIALAEIPDAIRGYGPVKEAAMMQASADRTALLEELALARQAEERRKAA